MPAYDAYQANPERYTKVRQEQQKMIEALKGTSATVRICPYCDKKISVVFPGYHGPEITKCHNCGEIIVFPSVKLSRSVDPGKARS